MESWQLMGPLRNPRIESDIKSLGMSLCLTMAKDFLTILLNFSSSQRGTISEWGVFYFLTSGENQRQVFKNIKLDFYYPLPRFKITLPLPHLKCRGLVGWDRVTPYNAQGGD